MENTLSCDAVAGAIDRSLGAQQNLIRATPPVEQCRRGSLIAFVVARLDASMIARPIPGFDADDRDAAGIRGHMLIREFPARGP